VRIGAGLDTIVAQRTGPTDQLVGTPRERPTGTVDPANTGTEIG
jgi:hypothetical protein